MSLPNSANAPHYTGNLPPVEKQHTNVYSAMLMLSFGALLTGCILFAMEWNKFEGKPPWDTRAAQPNLAAAAGAPAPGNFAPQPNPAAGNPVAPVNPNPVAP